MHYTAAMIVTLIIYVLGGIGLFILGMILMTDGLKTLAGDTLRKMLSRFTGGKASAITTGIGITALMQSSHATIIATIGFVSAGLLTFEQSVGIVIGAHIGTTSTGWLVSLLGLKMQMSMISLPALGIGAMMRLLGREKVAHIGFIIAGFGLIFLGIDTLQTGMKDLSGRINLSGYTAMTVSGRLLLVAIGIAMTVIMQSSSAAITMTLAALNTGTLTLDQSAALVVGQNIGTTLTAAIAAVGGSTPAKRTAAAHIIFNVITACVVFMILPVFLHLLIWSIGLLGGHDPTIILPAFHTAFNVFGMCIIVPFIGTFCRLIEMIIPQKGPVLTRNLDFSVAVIPAVAIEAARRTVRDISVSIIEVFIDILVRNEYHAAEQKLAASDDALAKTRVFLSGVRSKSGSTSGERARHISVLHILDHAENLIECCRETEHIHTIRKDEALSLLSMELCGKLQTVISQLNNPDGRDWLKYIEETSALMKEIRKGQREVILQQTALGGVDPEEAYRQIEAIRWLDRATYRIWRAAYHIGEEFS